MYPISKRLILVIVFWYVAISPGPVRMAERTLQLQRAKMLARCLDRIKAPLLQKALNEEPAFPP